MATGHNPLGINAYLNTRPAAEVRASEETEDQRDIRLVKETYEAGKKSMASCALILLRIHQRGNWKGIGTSWGKWCEATLGISKSYAYSIVQTPNPATDELKKYYVDQQSKVITQVNQPTSDSQQVTTSSIAKPEAQKPKSKPEPEGPNSEDPPPTPKVRTESGKPKRDLVIWEEMRKLLGVSGNRAGVLNEQCPNPVRKKRFLVKLDEARAELDGWWEETK